MISAGCSWKWLVFQSWMLRTEEDSLPYQHLLPESPEPSASHALSDDEMSEKSFLSRDPKPDSETEKYPAMASHFPQGKRNVTKHLRHNQAILPMQGEALRARAAHGEWFVTRRASVWKVWVAAGSHGLFLNDGLYGFPFCSFFSQAGLKALGWTPVVSCLLWFLHILKHVPSGVTIGRRVRPFLRVYSSCCRYILGIAGSTNLPSQLWCVKSRDLGAL